jgi:ribonuclease BN (tRNA processing enzyme)
LFNFHFLGTGSGRTARGRGSSALLCSSGGSAVLVDAGDGVSKAFLTYGVSFNAPDAIVITHTHPDHVSGLPSLLQSMHQEQRKKAIRVFVPAEAAAWTLELLRGMHIYPERRGFAIDILPLYPMVEIRIGDMTIIPVQNRHLEEYRYLAPDPVTGFGSFSLILKDDTSRVYLSADLASIDEMNNSPTDTTCAVIECTHVSLDDIMAYAENRPRCSVIVTHVSPSVDPLLNERGAEIEAKFGNRVIFARDGLAVSSDWRRNG